eukprot:CAMPEP_0172519518 /NCGR_PEP_ID=MMETSP1066-20121228/291464_1 /TAXON_ID=671091 /ORGANISM="Coscinodiscus wailesii, Strain CCMP2513" /LENGTH=386 /DNA_ID=CAMNT_0013302119 /DNA_START=55 /DNA_END=1216 /DNA_ORIENTATION=+
MTTWASTPQQVSNSRFESADNPPWAHDNDGPEIISEGFETQSQTEESLTQPLEQNKSNKPAAAGPAFGQKVALYLSHVLAIVALGMVSALVNDQGMGGGGLSWEEGQSKKVFNWHPLMMVSAFILMTLASLAFRNPFSCSDRWKKKMYHGLMWVLAATCMMVGMIAVVKSHNDAVSGYIANLYSLHSWIGIAVLSLYSIQFVGGVTFFGFQIGTGSLRARMLSLHQFLGPVIYFAMVMTILLGLQEKKVSLVAHILSVSGYIANLYSLYTWIGIVVLLLYLIRFVGGVTLFGFQFGTGSLRARMLSLHQFLGPVIYFAMVMTILLGLQEKEGFIGCSYTVTEADLRPYQHFNEIPYVCRLSHGLGIVIFTMALTTAYALYNFPEDE